MGLAYAVPLLKVRKEEHKKIVLVPHHCKEKKTKTTCSMSKWSSRGGHKMTVMPLVVDTLNVLMVSALCGHVEDVTATQGM